MLGRITLAVIAGALVQLPEVVLADGFPSRPVTIIVPFSAGGGGDVTARIVAEGMRNALGQSVIVENVTGAGGSIGTGRVARAQPDGYTLIAGQWGTHVANPILYKLDYDVVADFEPIGLLTYAPMLVVGRKDLPANDLKGLVAWLNANPHKASAGTSGNGSLEHVPALLFQKATGTRFDFIPYRGSAPAIQDVVGGQLDLIFCSITAAQSYIRAGRVKVFAVMSDARFAGLPDVPTVDEAGVPGVYFSGWNALYAPKGTPRDVVAKLNRAMVSALADPQLRQRFVDPTQVAPVERQTPDGLRALQKSDIEKWWPLMRAAGIKPE
jgi:tripartite-type tricarboxylate transporter receptor subunit TctC